MTASDGSGRQRGRANRSPSCVGASLAEGTSGLPTAHPLG